MKIVYIPHRYLATLVDQFNYSTDTLLDKLDQMADGSTVINMLDEVNRFTLHTIGKV